MAELYGCAFGWSMKRIRYLRILAACLLAIPLLNQGQELDSPWYQMTPRIA